LWKLDDKPQAVEEIYSGVKRIQQPK